MLMMVQSFYSSFLCALFILDRTAIHKAMLECDVAPHSGFLVVAPKVVPKREIEKV